MNKNIVLSSASLLITGTGGDPNILGSGEGWGGWGGGGRQEEEVSRT